MLLFPKKSFSERLFFQRPRAIFELQIILSSASLDS